MNDHRTPPTLSASEALQLVESGDRVYIHEAAMAPWELLEALADRAAELQNVETISMHTDGPAPHVSERARGHIRHNALFVGSNVRDAVNEGYADYTPVFLSRVPDLISSGDLHVDVALVMLSPPDRHGFCSLGVSVACARAAVDNARTVIALVNPRAPRTLGHSAIHVSRLAAMVDADRALPEIPRPVISETDRQIGRHVATLVPNGATLQVGIGAMPEAVLSQLTDREELGVHTEMFSDGIVDLAEMGVITNTRKTSRPGRIITSFALGTQRLYDFVDDNPFVEFHNSGIVNDTREIRKNARMVSINSAIEIDLTGQVVADSIGARIYSGIGGQMDFVHGAQLAPEGKAIIALPATAKGGMLSRVVAELHPSAGIVTTRGHVQYVATEYGIVNLAGQSLRRRAELMISIAHPAFRTDLRAKAAHRHLFAQPLPSASHD